MIAKRYEVLKSHLERQRYLDHLNKRLDGATEVQTWQNSNILMIVAFYPDDKKTKGTD